jgi:isopropylmalate/homocitrate/citramalate synthase
MSGMNDDEPTRTIEVIDCTLRDGEQAPGVWFTVAEKLELARMLARAGVDMLDAGFPAASGADLEAMQQMRAEGLACRIAATARALRADIEAAQRSRAHEVFMFMPTSDLRLQTTLGITRAQALGVLREGAEEAAARGLGVNLVYEDATRAEIAWMCQLTCQVATHVPVRRLILADTVGCALPSTMARLIAAVRCDIPAEIVITTHCHNDFGLAVANTLAAVSAGAGAVTCTINGIGERAGNADLAETVAAFTHLLGVAHRVDPRQLSALAQLTERLSGVLCSPLKPITGFNVYRHESGVHVDGMLKDARSYEFLPASWVGHQTQYVLGKHSGRALIRHVLCQLGVSASESEEAELLSFVKRRVEERDKTDHARAFREKEAFQAAHLSGIEPKQVLGEYLAGRAERRAKS